MKHEVEISVVEGRLSNGSAVWSVKIRLQYSRAMIFPMIDREGAYVTASVMAGLLRKNGGLDVGYFYETA